MALSPTAFTVPSGCCTLKRKSPTRFGLTFHSTEKSTSTMFSSPVSIKASSGTSRTASARIKADVDLVDPQRLRRKRGLDWIGQIFFFFKQKTAYEMFMGPLEMTKP